MDWLGVLLSLVCHVLFFHVEAQPPLALPSTVSFRFGYQFEANFPFIAGIVALVCLVCWLLLCSFFQQAETVYNRPNRITGNSIPMAVTVAELMPVISGLDRAMIESLPKFRFSSLRGPKDGMECSVCLSGFKDVEVLRLLPKCKHTFHVKCIDRWLENNSSCPLCRDRIEISSNHSILVDEDDAKPGNGTDDHDAKPGNGTDDRGDSNAIILVEREEHHRSLRFSGDVREQLPDDDVETMHRGTSTGSTTGL